MNGYLKISLSHFVIAGLIIFLWLFVGCSYNSFLYGPVLEPKKSSRVTRMKRMTLIEQLEQGISLHEYSARTKSYGGNDPEWDLEWVKIYQKVIEKLENCKGETP